MKPTVPHKAPRVQRRKSQTDSPRTIPPLVPLDTIEPWPANEDGPDLDADGSDARPRINPDGPACCPFRFCRKASALLDMVLLATDVLADLKAALEEETLP